MAQMFRDDDADLTVLEGKTIAVIGYGNQGRPQALNLRDSGCKVIVGNRAGSARDLAKDDGFDAMSLRDASKRADVIVLLLADEIAPTIFDEEIRPGLEAGNVLVLASGYNITYQRLQPPESVDVVMVAPRMIGTGVRDTFLSGVGFPSLVAVGHDASGRALDFALAVAKGIGSTKMGAFMSSFDEETLCDLFNEHFGYVYALRRAYEVLSEAGCSPEAIMLEFYASGEEMELAKAHMEIGLFHQLRLHSMTSQYGQEVTARLSAEDEMHEKNRLRRVIGRIKDGSFDREWQLEQQQNMPTFRQVRRENFQHPMIQEERAFYRKLGRVTSDEDDRMPLLDYEMGED
jgi:ketol-acid reductoisomerase